VRADEIAPVELVRRLGRDDAPEARLLKGIWAHRSHATSRAREIFASLPPPLGEAMIQALEQGAAQPYRPTQSMKQPCVNLPSPRRCNDLFWRLGLAACVCAAAAVYARWPLAAFLPVDDAYITMHNARALLEGADPNFAGVAPLTGATSLLHLLLLAAAMRFLPAMTAACVVLWLGVFLYAAGVLELCLALRLPHWKTAAIMLCALLAGLTPHQLTNGLETGWAMAAVAWCCALAARDTPAARLGLAALCGLMPALRPELAAFAGLTLLCLAARAWRVKPAGARRSALARLALAAILAALPWMAIYLAATGLPFPSTIAAKRLFFAEDGLPSAVKLMWSGASLSLFAVTMGPLIVGAAGLFLADIGVAGLLFGAVLIGAYFCYFPGALGHYEQRYLYLLTPLLAYGLARLQLARAPRLRLIAGTLLVGAAANALLFTPAWVNVMTDGRAFTRDNLAAVAAWCQRHMAPDARVYAHDIGYISWATRLPLVDMVGLKAPRSTAWHRHFTAASGGQRRDEAVDAIGRAAQPDWLIVLRGWDRLYNLTGGLRAHDWRLVKAAATVDGYEIYRVQAPKAEAALELDAAGAGRAALKSEP
jgi:hypothetical protein